MAVYRVYLGGVDMHIAVCDDNVADRKQLERLLKRESDKRAASTGIIYTDSFGNSASLLSNPMQYDAFYIDMCLTEGTTGTDVVNALTAQGVNAPIVLCCIYWLDHNDKSSAAAKLFRYFN